MKRKRHYTGWAGVLATAAELTRRCYDVTLTFGNTPKTDLLAAAEDGSPFRLQVKSASSPNWVPIQKSVLECPVDPHSFYVIVLIPSKEEEHFRFFILTHAEVQAGWAAFPKVKKSGEPIKPGWEGIGWSHVKPHENCWHKLPGWRSVDSSETPGPEE
jgi:hypothetical protein